MTQAGEGGAVAPVERLEPTELGTILGIWAHPDDETYVSAGIMAAAVDAGQRVVCVTATRGEAGSQDELRWPSATLADVRSAELTEALARLGVTEHRWLNYPDGGCAVIPEADAVARLVDIIAEVAPDTVLTFPPDGGTWHPDHMAVCRWTTAAFAEVGKPGARLLYAVLTPEVWELMTSVLDPSMLMMAERPPVLTPADECSILQHIEGAALERKRHALEAQPSQTASLIAVAGPQKYSRMLVEEAFQLAAVTDGGF